MQGITSRHNTVQDCVCSVMYTCLYINSHTEGNQLACDQTLWNFIGAKNDTRPPSLGCIRLQKTLLFTGFSNAHQEGVIKISST